MHLVLATLETRSFTFQSLATTKEGALAQLREGWKAHARQYDADPGYLDEHLDEVEYQHLHPGAVLRDGEVIVDGGPMPAPDTTSPERATWLRMQAQNRLVWGHDDFDWGWLDGSFKDGKGRTHRITGWNARAPKYPVCTSASDGRLYRWPVAAITQFMRQKGS